MFINECLKPGASGFVSYSEDIHQHCRTVLPSKVSKLGVSKEHLFTSYYIAFSGETSDFGEANLSACIGNSKFK